MAACSPSLLQQTISTTHGNLSVVPAYHLPVFTEEKQQQQPQLARSRKQQDDDNDDDDDDDYVAALGRSTSPLATVTVVPTPLGTSAVPADADYVVPLGG